MEHNRHNRWHNLSQKHSSLSIPVQKVTLPTNRFFSAIFILSFLRRHEKTRVYQMAPVEKSAKKAPVKGKKPTKFRKATNSNLSGGIMRYSRHQQYKRKALWRQKATLKPKVQVPKKPLTVVKEIGGAHNGGKRVVTLRKNKANYPTKALVTKRPTKGCFKLHKRNTRKSLIPGRVVIVVAGKHKGKRVIVLKVLQSGLLLISGPFSLNSCPLRRISQRYVIATQTRINMDKVVIPDHINDAYFKREIVSKIVLKMTIEI